MFHESVLEMLTSDQLVFVAKSIQTNDKHCKDPVDASGVALSLGWLKTFDQLERFLVGLARCGAVYNVKRETHPPKLDFVLSSKLCH